MRFKLAVAALAAAILTVAGVTLASANSNGSANDNGGHAIKLFATTVQQDFLDLGAQGFSLGDEQVFSDDVYDKKGGTKLGFDGGACTIVRISDAKTGAATAQCVVTLSLASGDIATQGLVTFPGSGNPPPFKIAITGGTGAYKDARGQVTVEVLSDTDSNLTVALSGGGD